MHARRNEATGRLNFEDTVFSAAAERPAAGEAFIRSQTRCHHAMSCERSGLMQEQRTSTWGTERMIPNAENHDRANDHLQICVIEETFERALTIRRAREIHKRAISLFSVTNPRKQARVSLDRIHNCRFQDDAEG
jgi:hypothetical protein